MTGLTIKRVEYVGESLPVAPENVTWTEPATDEARRRRVSEVLARVDNGYALDLVVMLQMRARMAKDTGERLSLDDFAREEGWEDELNDLRSE